jgi:hypothetical protein
MPSIPENDISRFLSRLDRTSSPDGCWLWTGGMTGNGRGAAYATIDGVYRQCPAHRLAYMIFHGDIPEGLFVCHHCDIPRCCNPDHLFIGTNRDNMIDMYRKGRNKQPRGESCSQSRLTLEQAKDILRRYKPYKVTTKMLADEYGVSMGAIAGIVRGRNWPEAK